MAIHINNEQLEKQLISIGASKNSVTYFRNPDFVSFCLKTLFNPYHLQLNNHSDQEEFLKNICEWRRNQNLIPTTKLKITQPFQINNIEPIFCILISYYNANIIPNDKLAWISKTNIRQTAFLYAATKYACFNTMPIAQNQFSITNILFNFAPPLISSIFIPPIISSLSDPYQNRKSFIDFFNFIDTSIQIKLASIDYIKSQWEALIKNNTSPKWIEKESNESFYSWFRGNNEIINNTSFGWVFNDVNYTDKYAIITFFDLLYSQNPSLGELTLKKLKNAWTQAKFRTKNKDRTQFNFVMDSRFKNELKEMSRSLRKSQSQLVEEAIDKMLIEYKTQRQL